MTQQGEGSRMDSDAGVSVPHREALSSQQVLPRLPLHTYRPEVGDARGGADASARVEHHMGGLPNQLCQLPHLPLQLLRGVEDLLCERAKGSDVIRTCPTVARPLATDRAAPALTGVNPKRQLVIMSLLCPQPPRAPTFLGPKPQSSLWPKILFS